ncbi:MAG: hypothetical protein CSA64_00315, partial [Arachnia propionica]
MVVRRLLAAIIRLAIPVAISALASASRPAGLVAAVVGRIVARPLGTTSTSGAAWPIPSGFGIITAPELAMATGPITIGLITPAELALPPWPVARTLRAITVAE